MKPDCRSINKGNMCSHLYQWDVGHKDMGSKICTCKALNVLIFPEFTDFGKMTQKLIQVKPLFDCPQMQELRMKGIAPNIMGTINKE